MSEQVTVRTGEVQLRTCKLNKSIIKQMPILAYRDLVDKNILLGSEIAAEDENKRLDTYIVGWISGAGIGESASDTWLIIKTGEGDYGRFSAHFEHRKRFNQIYII